MAIYDYSPTKVELQSLIQFFSGGRCNVTLGERCYIHLTTETYSYVDYTIGITTLIKALFMQSISVVLYYNTTFYSKKQFLFKLGVDNILTM